MSVVASTSGSLTRMRATSSATLPLPTTTARPLDRSGAISSKCGCALYQPTKSTAATLPGRSSPGMPSGPVRLRTDGVDHRVVALGELGGLDMVADGDVAEEPEPRIDGGLLELGADRLDLRMIRGDAGTHQPPRRRQHLQHVDAHVALWPASSSESANFNSEAAAKYPEGPEPTIATWYGRIHNAFCRCPARHAEGLSRRGRAG